ncbi:MAG: WbqC family protein [Thermodesulfobacteriota bacterium]
MILATSRPYFAPFPGFFARAALADIFVILDTVQFPRGSTWISRNRFKGPGGPVWVTVPVWKKGLGLQRIRDVRICHEGPWARKLMDTLWHGYKNAPWFHEHMAVWEQALKEPLDRLVDLDLALIRHLMNALEIKTPIVLLSELGIEATGHALLLEICRRLGESVYLAQDAARAYLRPELFQDAGLELRFMRQPSPVYPQLWGEFAGNLSAFDLVFNCGPKSGEYLSNEDCARPSPRSNH